MPIPHVTSHLLVLEDATGILAITRRAVGTVRNGYAVGGAHTPETPTLHRTSKALTLRMTGDVDQLPCDEMVSRKLSSDVQQRVISDTEFSNLQLGFNFRFGEVAALRLRSEERSVGKECVSTCRSRGAP